MTLIQAIDRIERTPGVGRGAASPVDLKCPRCLAEFSISACMAFDARVKCAACNATSEFRELHETWCSIRRPTLALNFPDLAWLTGGEILAPLSSEDAMRGDRRAAAPQLKAAAGSTIDNGLEDHLSDEAKKGRPARRRRKMDSM